MAISRSSIRQQVTKPPYKKTNKNTKLKKYVKKKFPTFSAKGRKRRA
jgi:hypothetical protein|tara:strand:- start:270 stop:410 length:141 start_codon:yes stop_codon:yes gene_type:complete